MKRLEQHRIERTIKEKVRIVQNRKKYEKVRIAQNRKDYKRKGQNSTEQKEI